MSNTVDSRVVEMTFDNKQFESAVQTSLKTLDKLKDSVKFDKAARGLDSLQKASNNFSLEGMAASVEALSNRFSTMGIVGMTVIQNLTNSALHFAKNMWDNTIGQIKSGGLARAMNIEQAKFQLKGLGVAWDEISDDINYGVKSTAYGLDAAAKAASQLVASGVEFGEAFGETGNSPMAKALRGISGVAAMTNSSYEEISSIYTTVAGQGKLMTMQLRQLESRGLNAAAQLGKVLGYSEEEIREFVTAGAIDFATFSEAMDEAFGEHAKAANETFSGSLSNVRSALSRIGAKVATVYLEKMRNVFVALIPVIDNLNKALDPFLSLINKGITFASEKAVKVLNKFNDALQHFTKPFDGFKQKVEEVKTVVDDVAHIEEMAWKVIRGDYGNGEARKKALTAEGESWALIQNKVNEFLDCPVRHEVEEQNKSIEEQVEKIAEVNNEYANWLFWYTRVSNIGSNFRRIISNIAEAIRRVGAAFSNAFKETNFRPLIAFFSRVTDYVRVFTENFKMGEKASNNLKNTFKGLIAVLKLVAETFLFVVEAAMILLSPLFDIISVFTGITGSIGDFVSGEVDALEATELFSKTLDKLKRFIEPIRRGIRKLATSFSTLFSSEKDLNKQSVTLKDVFSRIFDVLSGIGKAVYNFLLYIKDGVVWLYNYVSQNEKLNKVFSAMKTVLTMVGGAIYYAFTNLSEFVNKLLELPAVQKIITSIKDAFENLFELVSPYLEQAGNKITEFAEKMKDPEGADFETTMANINTQLETFITNCEGAWNGLKNFFSSSDKAETLINNFENIGNVFNDLQKGTLFSDAISGGVSEAFKFDEAESKIKGLADTLKEKFGKIDIGKILGLTLGAASVTSLLNFAQLENSLTKMSNNVTGLLGSLKGGLNNILGVTARKENLSTTILKIAFAIGILAVSLGALAAIPSDQLQNATTCLAVIFGMVAGLAALFGNFTVMFKNSPLFSKTGDTTALGATMLMISGSILILVVALKALESLKMEGIWKRLGILLGILTSLTMVAIATSRFAPQMSKGGISLLLMAFAVEKLAKVLIMLSNADMNNIGRAIKSLTTIMFMLAILAIAASRVKFTSALGILGLVTSLIILEKALMYIAEDFKPELIIKNLKSFILIFGTMFVLALVMGSGYGKYSARAGAGMLAMAGALLLTAFAMEKIGKISKTSLDKALRVIKTLVVIVAGTMEILEWTAAFNKKGANSLKNFIGFAIAIGVLVAALLILTTIKDQNALMRATASLSGIIIAFGVAVTLVSKMKTDKSIITGLAVMTGMVVGLAFLLKMLAAYDWKSLAAAAGALGGVMIALSVAMVIASKGNIDPKSVLLFLGASLSVLLIAQALAPLAQYQWDSILGAATAISEVLIALAIALDLATIAGNFAGAAGMGIVLIDVFMLDLMGLLDIMGTFASEENLAIIEKGVAVVEKIGEAIGGFWGSIVGGFGEAVTNSLPVIGENLSIFGNNIQGFVDAVSNVKEDAVSGAANLAESIGALALSIKARTFKNSDRIDEFGTGINLLADYLIQFHDKLTGKTVDVEKIESASLALSAMADFANKIPRTGGLVKGIAGDNSLKKFGEELEAFKKPFVNWSHAMEFVSPDIINRSTAAAETVAAFANKIPTQGGALRWIIGEKSLATFGTELLLFSVGFKLYSKNMEAVKPNIVRASSAAAESVAEFANKIPTQGGVLQDLIGEKSLATFGVEMVHFAFAFSRYVDIMKYVGANTDVVDSSTAAAETVATFASKLEPHHGFLQLFTGDNTLSSFGKDLESFGLSFGRYNSYVRGVKEDIVNKSISIAEALLALSGEVSESGTTWWEKFIGSASLVSFGADIELFGQNIAKFYNHISGISPNQMKVVANVVTAFADVESTSGENIKAFAQGLKELSGDSLKEFLNAFEEQKPISDTIFNMFKMIVSEIRSKNDTMRNSGQMSALAFVNGLKKYVSNAREIGRAYVSSFIRGVESLNASVSLAGSNTGLGFTRGIESQRQSAIDAAAETGRQAVKALNDAAGNASPSKKTKQSGVWFDQGFVNGIYKLEGAVQNAASDVGDTAIDALAETIMAISEVVNTDIDMDPTIRPVLDLSNVSAGAARLNAMLSTNRALSISADNAMIASNLNTEGSLDGKPGTTYNFTQNNYSPKALSRVDIYRQTRNQFAQLKGVAGV